MKDGIIPIFDDRVLNKSNVIIRSQNNMNLVENKIMDLATSSIQLRKSEKYGVSLVSELYPSDLKRILDDESNIYRDLSKASQSMLKTRMYLENGNGEFWISNVVTDCIYKNGVFTIHFNKNLAPLLLNEENKNYTTLRLAMLANIKKNSSYRIYQFIKSYAYLIHDKKAGYSFEYELSRLRFIVGMADVNSENAKRAMKKFKNAEEVDWDYIFDSLDDSEKMYPRWADFERYVLKPASKELAEKCDYRFDYKPVKEGKSVKRIEFTVYENSPENVSSIEEKVKKIKKAIPEGQVTLYQYMREELVQRYLDHNGLREEDINYFFLDAECNAEAVIKAIELADTKECLENYVGWIRKCIKERYWENENVKVVEGSSETAKVMDEISRGMEKNKFELEKKFWEKAKTNDDFKKFEEEINNLGFDVDYLEGIYSLGECGKIYVDWKRNGAIEL